jgi:acyl transferase domain-containing protein
LLGTLCRLYAVGHEPDWPALYGPGRRPVELPAYPWQRRRFWFADAPDEPVDAASEVEGDGRRGALRATVAAAAPADAEATVLAVLQERLAAALERDGEEAPEVDPAEPLGTLDLGSLAVVELKNEVERELDVPLPLAILTGESTLAQLAAYLTARLRGADGEPAISAQEARALLERLDELTDDDIAATLGRLGSGR